MFSDSIYQSFAIENQLSIVEGKGGFPTIKIDNVHATAVISIYGAQVLSYQPKGQTKDLLFVSEKAFFEEGKEIKGGIPICWPWFAMDQEKVGKTMHGFTRRMLWQLEETSVTNDGETVVVFSLSENAESLTIWPHVFKLLLTVRIGKTLKLSLQTTNTGDSSFIITQALHTYFAIDEITQVKVKGLNEISYFDKVTGKTMIQKDDVFIDQEVDRIYQDAPLQLTLLDESSDRKVIIDSKGSKTAIIWNAWVDLSKRSADLADDAYKHYICIETANAAQDRIIIEPSKSHTIAVEYTV